MVRFERRPGEPPKTLRSRAPDVVVPVRTRGARVVRLRTILLRHAKEGQEIVSQRNVAAAPMRGEDVVRALYVARHGGPVRRRWHAACEERPLLGEECLN